MSQSVDPSLSHATLLWLDNGIYPSSSINIRSTNNCNHHIHLDHNLIYPQNFASRREAFQANTVVFCVDHYSISPCFKYFLPCWIRNCRKSSLHSVHGTLSFRKASFNIINKSPWVAIQMIIKWHMGVDRVGGWRLSVQIQYVVKNTNSNWFPSKHFVDQSIGNNPPGTNW